MSAMASRMRVVEIVMQPWVTVMMLFDNDRPHWCQLDRRASRRRRLHRFNDLGRNALLM